MTPAKMIAYGLLIVMVIYFLHLHFLSQQWFKQQSYEGVFKINPLHVYFLF